MAMKESTVNQPYIFEYLILMYHKYSVFIFLYYIRPRYNVRCTCYTNSMGVYLTAGYSNGTKRSPPPRGRMYLDNDVTHDSGKIKYNHTTFAASEVTEVIAATTEDTSIFNHFESI